jgi:hypothetical protein
MTSGFIVIHVDLADGADGAAAAQEVFDIVGNELLTNVEYVLSAEWQPLSSIDSLAAG